MTDLERDILKELMNIILAKAGDSFAKISKEEVLISVPELHMATKTSAITDILSNKNIEVIIQSEVKGDLYAHTLIFFSKIQIEMLERVCLKGDLITIKMRESLLLEISNIVTGTIVSHLADILKLNIYGSVPIAPIYKKSIDERELLLDLDVTRPVLLTVNTVFKTSDCTMDMPMAFILDIPNLTNLLMKIRSINKDNFSLLKG
ncbi:MAG: chemotaxis protein CheC [Fulvivirga sp.]